MRIEYSKWDGRPHWRFDAVLLGDDDHGRWFGAPIGGELRRGEEPPVTSPGLACLMPHAGRWIAHFALDPNPEGAYVYINVTDEPLVTEDAVTAVDLDLDVVGWRDGRVDLEDEDEFEKHAALFRYPTTVVLAARVTAQELVTAVRSRDEPFGRAHDRWVDAARRL